MRNPSLRATQNVRSKKHRSKFSVSSLLLAGAISFAGLFTSSEAFALAGTLTASGETTTPRDSSGASGGATLIRTAASSTTSTSSESSSTQQVGPTESSSSSSASVHTQGGSRRRAQTEEGTTHRRTTGTSTAHTSRQGGKAVVDSKDQKSVAPVPMAPDRVHFSLSAGFESRYIYHGLDVIAFNSKIDTARLSNGFVLFSPQLSSSAIEYTNADVAFKGFHLGVGYIRAIDATYPFYQRPTVRDATTTAGQVLGANTITEDAVPGNHRRHYQEVDVSTDYTVSIIGGILDGTAGYNSYFFAYRDYKGAAYQGEVFARLAYKQLKYVVPSFTYYRYISSFDNDHSSGNLNGDYTEFRIDGAVPIYNNSIFGVTFAPYIAAGYNIDYLKYSASSPYRNDVGGWNDLEMGIKLPTRIGKNFVVTPYGNYGLDISGNTDTPINNFTGNGYGERTHFWGGVTVAYSF